MVMSFLNEASK